MDRRVLLHIITRVPFSALCVQPLGPPDDPAAVGLRGHARPVGRRWGRGWGLRCNTTPRFQTIWHGCCCLGLKEQRRSWGVASVQRDLSRPTTDEGSQRVGKVQGREPWGTPELHKDLFLTHALEGISPPEPSTPTPKISRD